MAPVVIVAGARPNFMKIAPILRELERRGHPFPDLLVHTGQHYDYEMSEIFFKQLGIRAPDAHLAVGSGSHAAQTAQVMTSFERYLESLEEPARGVVVVGDVNSTMACTLVAVKMGIAVAHVEAGLRSFDRSMPEEINRIVTDAVAELLLVSDPAGLTNLAREGIATDKVIYVGNVMIDTLVQQLDHARALGMIDSLGLRRGEYAIVTLHRPSNVDVPERLRALAALLVELSERMPVVFPIHPRTRARLCDIGAAEALENAPGMRIMEPIGYHEILGLLEGAKIVISDSGGIQEETSYLGVPCVTLRPSTERPVTVTSGTNTIVGDDVDALRAVIAQVEAGRYKSSTPIEGWDGRAAERVVNALVERWFGG